MNRFTRGCRFAMAFGVALLAGAPAAVGQRTSGELSGDALAIACGPRAVFEKPAATLTVGGSLAGAKGVFAPWHRIVITGGSDEGVTAGQQYYVRRVIAPNDPPKKGERVAYAVVTAGWVRVDQVQSHRSIASILHECDGIVEGDYLEPFAVPAVPTPLPPGQADYSDPATVLFGADRTNVAGGGSMVIIDKGSSQGIRPGQRFTIFRASGAGPNVIVAHALALLVEPETTTVRVQDMRDAVQAGDRVAPHRQQ